MRRFQERRSKKSEFLFWPISGLCAVLKSWHRCIGKRLIPICAYALYLLDCTVQCPIKIGGIWILSLGECLCEFVLHYVRQQISLRLLKLLFHTRLYIFRMVFVLFIFSPLHSGKSFLLWLFQGS